MAQGKTYRNCSSLTTPPAIQGPEVSASRKRTSQGDVLMTVWMPKDTVNSEVYVTGCRQSASACGLWDLGEICSLTERDSSFPRSTPGTVPSILTCI